jgi:mono/diheme cytochrome c family protein
MNESTTEQKSRRPLRLALGGCAIILIALLCALIVNAVYWSDRMGVLAGGAEQSGVTPVALESLPPGDAAAGAELFGGEAACSVCHSLEPDKAGAGPSLAGLAGRAANTVPDVTSEAYILESITHPDALIVEGYAAGIMPSNYGQRLSPQQLADLLAFLLTETK